MAPTVLKTRGWCIVFHESGEQQFRLPKSQLCPALTQNRKNAVPDLCSNIRDIISAPRSEARAGHVGTGSGADQPDKFLLFGAK